MFILKIPYEKNVWAYLHPLSTHIMSVCTYMNVLIIWQKAVHSTLENFYRRKFHIWPDCSLTYDEDLKFTATDDQMNSPFFPLFLCGLLSWRRNYSHFINNISNDSGICESLIFVSFINMLGDGNIDISGYIGPEMLSNSIDFEWNNWKMELI